MVMDLFGDDIVEHTFDDEDIAFDEPVLPPHNEGLHHPKDASLCIGHEAVEKEILSLWNSGRMPHAIVLNGLQGIGKCTFAYRLARFVLKDGAQESGLFGGEDAQAETLAVSSDDPVFRKVSSGGHPDMLTISRPFDESKGRYKSEIPVDDIRKVAPFLRSTSSNGGWRVVLIDDANHMNRNGQNAILKILEEPPKKTLLILVTHGAGGLLPTIRSRCRFIGFQPLNESDLLSILEKGADTPLMPADKDILVHLAQGSAGQAIALYQKGGLEMIHQALEALIDIQTLSAQRLDELALSIGKSGDDEGMKQFLYIINWWFETLIDMAARGQDNRNIGHFKLTEPQGHNLHSLLTLHEAVEDHVRTCLNGTLDKRYMIFKLLRMVQGA